MTNPFKGLRLRSPICHAPHWTRQRMLGYLRLSRAADAYAASFIADESEEGAAPDPPVLEINLVIDGKKFYGETFNDLWTTLNLDAPKPEDADPREPDDGETEEPDEPEDAS